MDAETALEALRRIKDTEGWTRADLFDFATIEQTLRDLSDLRGRIRHCPYCAHGYECQDDDPAEGPCPGCRRAEALAERVERERERPTRLELDHAKARARDAEAEAARLREAETWYREHVSSEGIYDEAMWGDPFAISPQLRSALSPPTDGEAT